MKKLKGFTLVECIVALAILGIASLVMVEIYANVCKINRANHDTNSSLAYQMKYVEKKNNLEAISVEATESYDAATGKPANDTPPHKRTGVTNISITGNGNTYSFPVDYHVLQSRDQNDQAAFIYNASSNSWVENSNYIGDREDNYYLSYKYWTPNTN